MRKFLLLLIGVTFLCVNNSNAQNNKSDDLGNVEISFKDPIIIPDRENTGNGYKIYTYNTGCVELMILPVRKF